MGNMKGIQYAIDKGCYVVFRKSLYNAGMIQIEVVAFMFREFYTCCKEVPSIDDVERISDIIVGMVDEVKSKIPKVEVKFDLGNSEFWWNKK